MSGPGVLDFRIGEVRFQMLTLDPDFELCVPGEMCVRHS